MLLLSFAGAHCGMTEQQQPVCYAQNDCVAGLECRLGRCSRPTNQVPDASETINDAGQKPDSGAPSDAGQKPDAGLPACALTGTCLLGEKCSSAADCKSQFCNSGVCCNEQCGGDCAACNLTGSLGTCKTKPKGSTCGAYFCDGTNNSCSKRCSTADDCGAAYTCCTAATNEGSGDCVGRGLANTCFQLPACSSIRDDFEQTSIDPAKWYDYTAHLEHPSWIADGKLNVAIGLKRFENSTFSGLFLRQRMSLVGSSCQVEMADFSMMNNNSSFTLAGVISHGAGNTFDEVLRIFNGERLAAEEIIPGRPFSPTNSPALMPPEMRFLRIAEDGGVVSFSHSSNGNDFTEFHSVKSAQRLSDLTLELSVYEADVKPDAGGSVVFDNLNIRPNR